MFYGYLRLSRNPALLIALVIIMSCLSSCGPSTASPPTEKPTRRGAVNFTRLYWRFIENDRFDEALDLYLPGDRRFIKRDVFEYRFAQQNEQIKFDRVESVEMKGKSALATIRFIGIEKPNNSITKPFGLSFKDGKWYPKPNQRQLITLGAAPSRLGVEKVKRGREFDLPDFSAVVTFVSRKVSLDIDVPDELVIEITVTNHENKPLRFETRKYLALMDLTQTLYLPVGPSDQVVEINTGESITITVTFDAGDESGLSLLVGSDDKHFLVPL